MPIKPKFEITHGENDEFSAYIYLGEDNLKITVKKTFAWLI